MNCLWSSDFTTDNYLVHYAKQTMAIEMLTTASYKMLIWSCLTLKFRIVFMNSIMCFFIIHLLFILKKVKMPRNYILWSSSFPYAFTGLRPYFLCYLCKYKFFYLNLYLRYNSSRTIHVSCGHSLTERWPQRQK